jgi:integrase
MSSITVHGHVFFREPSASGQKGGWYVRWKEGGVWRQKATGIKAEKETRPDRKQAEAVLARGLDRMRLGLPFEEPEAEGPAPTFAKLAEPWAEKLQNRSAVDDQSRMRKHLIPKWGRMRLSEIDLKAVLAWLDEERGRDEDDKRKMSDATLRHCLNLLSRFMGWAVERGHADINPVRMIPVGRRPQQSQKRDVPWLDDDRAVRRLMDALPAPMGLMFYLGNRSGLRTGELCGLRLSDLAFLDEGTIRVRFSYDGPLKEDKRQEGKVKWVPAPADATAVLGTYLAAREDAGAGPEDFVFLTPEGGPFTDPNGTIRIDRTWLRTLKALAKADPPLKLDLTWYQSTRHSFVSRSLTNGASLDEVSSAVGHSSPVVTRRYYDHFVRRTFSDTLRAGLAPVEAEGEGGKGKMIPMRPAAAPVSQEGQGSKPRRGGRQKGA